ncbi:MAG: nodulation protein NfeD [Acidobacteriia bacterium]|jgi:membrane-bound serine protease (ClpP class)|nr:nodulation protein NfeD [Terriglobia bacterium]
MIRRRRLRLASTLAVFAPLAWFGTPEAPAQPSSGARVVELRIADAVMPMMAEYVVGGIQHANRTGAALVLITMDTPGGLDSSMREIISHILDSKVPVTVYVSPSGARAASAGFFILLAADVAAMAPGTNTGASSPVPLTGQQVDELLRRKATNDAAAYMRSIAGQRGRNAQLAEQAVTEAKAFSADEALRGGLIDLIVPTVEELLAKLHGRSIKRFDGSVQTLALSNPVREALEMNRKQKILSYIARPDVLFILMLIGILGIYAEFSNPGLILPGVVGALSLILALVAIQVLPINVIGILLILLAVGLFIAEAKLTSYGLLGLAGAVAMVAGALMLIDSPITGMGVSLGTALGATIPFALLAIFLMTLILRSYRWKPAVGTEALIGQIGSVTTAIDGTGQVFVAGELWRAAAPQKIEAGRRVRVVRVEGLTVHVEPVEAPAESGRNT